MDQHHFDDNGRQRDHVRLELSNDDGFHLGQLERKYQLVRDRTVAVVKGYQPAFILQDRGGVGKTHVILDQLDQLDAYYKLWNSHMTGRCLFDRLETFPDAVHFLEDIEDVVRDKAALGVLRSALWGPRQAEDGRLERRVTWNAKPPREFLFHGGIIMTMNRALGDVPELNALRTRISYMHLDATDREIAALMRKVALGGYRRGYGHLDPEECCEVAAFIIKESRQLDRPLDMRLLINAFNDRLQADDHDAGCRWQDLVKSRILERAASIGMTEPAGIRTQKKAKELEIARRIVDHDRDERLRVWREKTGKSESSLYRRLNELARSDAWGFE